MAVCGDKTKRSMILISYSFPGVH